MPETTAGPRRWIAYPSALSLDRALGVGLVAVVVIGLELAGRPAALDAAVILPIVILAAAAFVDWKTGVLAALIGGVYILLVAAQPNAALPGGVPRAIVSLAAAGIALWIAAFLSDRVRSDRAAATAAARRSELVSAFAARLATEPGESVPEAIVRGAAELVRADMAVLTVLEPASGRHVVRAALGSGSAAVGVEVRPGVGITGEAIRDRRVIASRGADLGSVSGLNRRLRGGGSSASMAAVAVLQAGRVIASLTVGRSVGDPFTTDDQRLLEAIGSLATLAVAAALVQGDGERGSSRDHLTGLYNRSYLDAALEQLVALRRRMAPETRPPLSAVLFAIDDFPLINEWNGRDDGDQVLRAVATVLRQRFRASDIVARVGEDTFLVVLHGATVDVASIAAAQIGRQVRELSLSNSRGEPVAVSISSGSALFGDDGPPESLIRSLESALDSTRGSGPGAVASA